jgi:hypothetical protein
MDNILQVQSWFKLFIYLNIGYEAPAPNFYHPSSFANLLHTSTTKYYATSSQSYTMYDVSRAR